MSEIVKPVFIIGSGRSGTTLFARMMSTHPDVAYFSSWTNQFPRQPWLAVLSRLNDIDFLEEKMRDVQNWPRITEAYNIWDHVFPGFSRPPEDLTRDDLDPQRAEKFKKLMRAHMMWQGKPRMLTKYVGWVRIDFVRAIFPDAYFICVDRDPRPTLLSQMKQKWGFEDRPHIFDAMSGEERVRYYVERYFLYVDTRKKFKEGEDYIQLYYENLFTDRRKTFRDICEAVELRPEERFLNRMDNWHVYETANDAWKKAFSPEQIALLNELLADNLTEMGYEI